MASLLPPDLHEYVDFVNYRDNAPGEEPPRRLREEIEERLTWK
jgi:DEAD/DEAH box helicase domain-containing protein